jgi:peptide/nickel transport system ATP-binding protein
MLVVAENVKKYFAVEKGLLGKLLGGTRFIRAVDGVSLSIDKGEILALVGESGSGKSTLGRLLVKLIDPDSGVVIFDGQDITKLKGENLRRLRRRMQIVFQDPYASLNPKMKIGDQITQILLEHNLATESFAKKEVIQMLKAVGLTPPEDFYHKYPHQLSGGQRQRVAIARALILKPDFLVADEPVSMLDVSIRASILDILLKFRSEYSLSILFITHDLSVARLIGDRIAVMYLGKIVEEGSAEDVIAKPLHPYTKALIDSIPSIRRRQDVGKVKLKEYIVDPVNPPRGCRLHPRCPFATKECLVEPKLIKFGNRSVACHHPLG